MRGRRFFSTFYGDCRGEGLRLWFWLGDGDGGVLGWFWVDLYLCWRIFFRVFCYFS